MCQAIVLAVWYAVYFLLRQQVIIICPITIVGTDLSEPSIPTVIPLRQAAMPVAEAVGLIVQAAVPQEAAGPETNL